MVVKLTPHEILPEKVAVLERVGIPPDQDPPEHVLEMHEKAIIELEKVAKPVGLFENVSIQEFAEIYRGEGKNAEETPLEMIYPKADHLALFAVTLGKEVTDAVNAGFEGGDFAQATILDAAGSAAADRAAEVMERRYEALLWEGGWDPPDAGVLGYSPGYCGWHVSGQRHLFSRLKPERIGLTLTDRFTMQPFKSVSGVMVAGLRPIHRFPPTFPFCRNCAAYQCRDRLQLLAQRRRIPDTL